MIRKCRLRGAGGGRTLRLQIAFIPRSGNFREYTMDMTELHTRYQFDRFGGMTLHDAAGREVTCLSGSIWLTMEGDTRDILLEPGTSFVIDRGGATILAAQAPSEVTVSAPSQPRGWRAWLADYFNRTYGPAAIRSDRKWIY
jgi:hypothetical protein